MAEWCDMVYLTKSQRDCYYCQIHCSSEEKWHFSIDEQVALNFAVSLGLRSSELLHSTVDSSHSLAAYEEYKRS